MQLPNSIKIRLARNGDRLNIVPLMRGLTEESLYKSLPIEDDAILETVDTYLQKDQKESITLVAENTEDNSLVGIIVGMASRLPFNRSLTCSEVVWYVMPSYRKSLVGITLYNAFLYWSNVLIGASIVHVASPYGSSLHKGFKKEGYKLFEEVYIKVL